MYLRNFFRIVVIIGWLLMLNEQMFGLAQVLHAKEFLEFFEDGNMMLRCK